MKPSDEVAFEAFVVARAGHLRRVAFLIVRDWQLAEDAVQTALIKVYRVWGRLHRESVDAYVRRAVVNTSISQARKPRREVVTDSIPDVAQPGPPRALDEDLYEALRGLTSSQAAVVALRYLEDMSIAEVADVLGVSEGTVKSQAARGLQRLRGLIKESI